MVKKLMIVTVIAALFLSACSALGREASTPTLAPSNTPAPAPTEAGPTEPSDMQPPAVAETTIPATETTPLPSATVEIPRPTNAPNCTNNASFVADITIPDNTEVDGGATFVKTWRILNTGTCIWGPDYSLIHYSDERLGAPASIPIPLTFPGQNADITVSLTAPNTVGVHRGNFVIKNPKGLIMKINDDSRLWLIIQVKNPAAATVATTVSAPTATQGVVVQPTNTTVSTGSGGEGFATPTCSFSTDQTKVGQVVNAINAYRQQNGLPAYTVNFQLVKAAQAHANDMACNGVTSDTGSNNSTVVSRVSASGYIASFSAENLYFSNPPVVGQDAVNTWINNTIAPKDKLNLISDTFIDMGVGYAFFNNSGYYVVVFGTP